MRSQNDSAENTAKTTESTAPMRGMQPEMETRRLRTFATPFLENIVETNDLS